MNDYKNWKNRYSAQREAPKPFSVGLDDMPCLSKISCPIIPNLLISMSVLGRTTCGIWESSDIFNRVCEQVYMLYEAMNFYYSE